jgi:hypothetical protein
VRIDVLAPQSTYQIGRYGSLLPWSFWKHLSAGTVQLVCNGFEEKTRDIHVAMGWQRTPIIVLQIAKGLGLDEFWDRPTLASFYILGRQRVP